MIENLQPPSEPARTIKLWTPNTIGTLTFFTGFPTGIALASINWFRMGMKWKALAHILIGMIGIVVIYLSPENLVRSVALLINLGFVAYIRYQIKVDINLVIDNSNIENAHWLSGFLTSLAGWGIAFVVIIIIVFLEPITPGTASYYYGNGVNYFDKGEYESAVINYSKAIERNPEDVYSYNNRGLSYINLSKYDLALADFNKAIELDPNYDKAYFNRALAYEDLEQISDAIQGYEKAIELTTDPSIQAYSEKELIKLKAIDNSVENGISHYNSGEKYYESGNFDQAIVEFTKAIELNPSYIDAYHFRANAYVSLGKYDLALADLDKAILLSPDNAFLYYVRGLFYKEIGNFDKVLVDQNKAISIDPQYADAYLERGVAYGNLGDHDSALIDFNKAVELNPNNPLYFYNRGIVNHTIGKYKQAINDFNDAIELNPEYVEVYNNRGVTHAILGNSKQAIADFNKVLELVPNDVQAYLNRGLTYKTLGQISEAISDYERALELSTDLEMRKQIEDILKELRGQ